MGMLQQLRDIGRRRLTGTPVVSTTRHVSLAEAAEEMDRYDISALAVYSRDHRHLVGIITERDITRAIAEGKDPQQTYVGQVATTRLVVKHRPPTRREAARLMKRHRIRHLIVRAVDGDRMISMRDVATD